MKSGEETVREVYEDCEAVQVWDFPGGPMNYARRFLVAYEREMAAKDAEIARLKAALTPVMECNTMDAAFGLDNALFAVRRPRVPARDAGRRREVSLEVLYFIQEIVGHAIASAKMNQGLSDDLNGERDKFRNLKREYDQLVTSFNQLKTEYDCVMQRSEP